MQAVTSVYDQYRENIESQHGYIERRIEVQLKAPSPESRLQFGDAGLELLVRYPVQIRNESEMDEQITRKVLDLIQSEPDVQARRKLQKSAQNPCGGASVGSGSERRCLLTDASLGKCLSAVLTTPGSKHPSRRPAP